MKIKEFNLPEWAFLDAHSHQGDDLEGRTVILHIRSATIFEAVTGEINLTSGAMTHKFKYKNRFGVIENHIFVLHYSATLKSDIASIEEYVFNPAEEWYKKYLDWEDKGIAEERISKLN